jgi:uncharacterized iron-regulated membrane protein
LRKWHRWLAVLAGVFIVWIATTGLAGQVISLAGGEGHDAPPTAAVGPVASGTPGISVPAPTGPDGPAAPAKPHRKRKDWYHFIIDLHSGAYFGAFGKIISAIMGAALLFFSLSGIWMYVNMFRKRKTIGRSGLFWN